MGVVNKTEFLNSLEDRVEDHLQLAVNRFQNLPESELLRPSENGGWSIAQCLWHLNSYGDFYLPEIDRAMKAKKGNPMRDTFKRGWIGSYFTKMVSPETGKRKMKAMKANSPELELDAYAVVAEYIRQQETLLLYIREAKHKDLEAHKLKTSVSVFINLKLGDVLQFLVTHDDRHLQQAKRNLV